MRTVNVHEAKTHLSRLLGEVERGEEIVIARDGEPVARLMPVKPAGGRKLGRYRGRIWISPDFDRYIPSEWEPYLVPPAKKPRRSKK